MCAAQTPVPADPYASLRLYNGRWLVRQGNAAADAKPDELTDECAQVGKYFTCQQMLNGKTGALLVFVPTETPGHFYTQNVRPDGRAGGRGELQIDGDRWTYSSKAEENGKTTYYRTINQFTGRDKIHSESAESSDGVNWKTTRSGDLVRMGAVAAPPAQAK
jgi:hypothetical protein